MHTSYYVYCMEYYLHGYIIKPRHREFHSPTSYAVYSTWYLGTLLGG